VPDSYASLQAQLNGIEFPVNSGYKLKVGCRCPPVCLCLLLMLFPLHLVACMHSAAIAHS
jgi:hypothetical protein